MSRPGFSAGWPGQLPVSRRPNSAPAPGLPARGVGVQSERERKTCAILRAPIFGVLCALYAPHYVRHIRWRVRERRGSDLGQECLLAGQGSCRRVVVETPPQRQCFLRRVGGYRGTSLIRNSASLGPCSRTMPGAIWWSCASCRKTPAISLESNPTFRVLDVHWRSPESGDFWYTSTQFQKRI